MPRPVKVYWSDDELVSLCWDYRVESGACTLGELCKATGLAKSTLYPRILRLVDSGRLEQSQVPGSLRPTDERLMRELPDGRLVEVKPKKKRRRRPA